MPDEAWLRKWLFETCHAEANWNMKNFIADQIERVRAQVGKGKVLLALSGGVANQGEVLLAPLRERVRARSFGARYAASHTRIELCTLGYRAGVIGAAMLARV